jgi:hypothetical protein
VVWIGADDSNPIHLAYASFAILANCECGNIWNRMINPDTGALIEGLTDTTVVVGT